MIVEKIYTKKRKRYFNASMILYFPESSQPLYFRATGLPIGKKGLFSGVSRLALIGNEKIKLPNETTLEILTENRKTYVEIECGGYKQMGIEGKYTFSKNIFVTENPDGTQNDGIPVTATFETQLVEWGDMVTTLNMDPFQIKGLVGFTIVPTKVTLDKSDLNNPYNIQFPNQYIENYYGGFSQESWKGIHIETAQVKLPSKLSPAGQERRTIGASQLLIDDQGFTGTIGTSNILSREEGAIDKWPFSIDSLNIEFFTNQLIASEFIGELEVPLFPNDPLDYNAIVGLDDYYFFSVSDIGSVNIPMWAADVALYDNTSIEIESSNGQFRAAAVLHGRMNIGAGFNGKEGKDFQVTGLDFEELRVQSYQPYVKLGRFSFDGGDNNALANFPISIQNVEEIERGDKVGIKFDALVQFMSKSDKGFGGQTNISILGELKDEEKKQSWRPRGVELNEVTLDVDAGAFKFYGNLQIYRQDAVYGKGFKGKIKANFMPGIEASAAAQFGNIDGYAYWYVDASVKTPYGIPLGPGIACYGFSGGASYHVRRENSNGQGASQQELESIQASNESPTESTIDNETGSIPTNNEGVQYAGGKIGESYSGVNYIPDRRIGLGLKAGVTIGTHPSPVAFNGEATFEIEFYAGGGISKVQFVGDAYFMTPLDNRPSSPPMRALLVMSYVTEGRVFHASLDTYFNLGVIKGTGSNGFAGRAVFHTEKGGGWYLYIGTPSKPISLYLLSVLKTNSYFMMGTELEPFPDPPSKVGEILGEMNTSLMRNENMLENAGGFAFGSSLFFDTGDITFLIFYGRIQAGAGVDVMLVNYGKDVECKGRSGGIGLNGWYAAGQAWAYLQGEVGIKIRLKLGIIKIRKKIKILEVGAAALLQAKLPNPTYLRGMIGGRFSVLGGLVKGNIRFKFTLGNQCEIVGANPLEAVPIIQQVSPRPDERDVSVFTVAQATLSIPVNKSFEMLDERDQMQRYRINLDFIRIKDGEQVLTGVYSLNDNKDVVAFEAHDILPPNKQLKVEVQVSFEQWKDGSWQKVIEDGKVITDYKEANFKTGDAPDHIPASNVKYSYPVANQLHFHPKETINGYIQLINGQPYLFEVDKSQFQHIIRMTNTASNQTFESAMTYNSGTRMINFNVPQNLTLDQLTKLEIITKPLQGLGAIDQNISVSSQSVGEGDLSDVTQSQRNIEGSLESKQETQLYEQHFKTSQYATFKNKMQAYNAMNQGWWWPIQTGVHKIGINLKGNEYFDTYELNGGTNQDPLIYLEADANNYWVRDVLRSLVYSPYPLDGMTFQWRDQNQLGIVPLKAVNLSQYPDGEQLNPSDPTTGPFNSTANFTTVEYQLPVVSYYDLYDLQQQAAIKISREKEPAPVLFDYLSRIHKPISTGHYDVKMQYVLPGVNKVTSSYSIKIQLK